MVGKTNHKRLLRSPSEQTFVEYLCLCESFYFRIPATSHQVNHCVALDNVRFRTTIEEVALSGRDDAVCWQLVVVNEIFKST